MSKAVLELKCGQCGEWLMRWSAEIDRPFDDQLPIIPEVPDFNVVQKNSPGGYQRASDGQFYRWTPDKTASLSEGESYARYEFVCPTGCAKPNVVARVANIEGIALTKLRLMHDTRMPLTKRLTVNSLLKS